MKNGERWHTGASRIPHQELKEDYKWSHNGKKGVLTDHQCYIYIDQLLEAFIIFSYAILCISIHPCSYTLCIPTANFCTQTPICSPLYSKPLPLAAQAELGCLYTCK